METHKNLLISGKCGSGKSFFFENNIYPYLLEKDKRQMIILDFKNEYNKGVILDIKQIKSIMDLARVMKGVYTKQKKPPVVTLKCEHFNPDEITKIYEYMSYTKSKILIHEESSFYWEDLKSGNPFPYWVKYFVRCKTLPHNGDNSIIYITQSPTDFPRIVLGQIHKTFLFELKPIQMDYLHKIKFLPHKPEYYVYDKPYKYYEID